MGVEYLVVCHDCRVMRNLDKFYTMLQHIPDIVKTRKDALEYQGEIERESFRAGLLVSFMGQHMRHHCTVLNEHDAEDKDLFTKYTTEDLFEDSE